MNIKVHDRLRHLMVIPVVCCSAHPSLIGVIQSLDNLGSSAFCFRWAMERLGTPVRSAQNIAETVSTVRRWELSLQAQNISKPFKTTNGPNGFCTKPSNSASWGHGPPPIHDPNLLICPASWSNLVPASLSRLENPRN